VLSEGARTLHVTSPQGRSVVRVELAVPIGLPKPRRSPPPVKPSAPPVVQADPPLRVAPEIVFDPDPGPYTQTLYARYRNLDVDDEDNLTGKSFLEIGLLARREIAPINGFAGLGAFVRVREGAPSFGFAGTFDVAPHGVIPGFFLRGRVVTQPYDGRFALGMRGLFGVLWSIPVADSFSLVPWAGVGLLLVDHSLKGYDAADREIWTRYTDKRPDYGVIGLRGLVRPAIDALGSISTSLRTTPNFAGVDRVDLEGQLHLLAGRGIAPWATVSAFLSYRPSGYERRDTFTRIGVAGQMTFWKWALRGHRFSAGADARVFIDTPPLNENSPWRVAGGIYLAYDFAGGRGLRDLPPRDAPFRARLEEESGRVDRRQSPSDPTWGTPP